MSKAKTRIERFDEAFKMLLIIMTITFSGSIAFYKEIMEPRFFFISASAFVIVIVLWTVSTLCDGKSEYFFKVFAWYCLITVYVTTFARLWFIVFLLPPLMECVVLLVSLALTLPILWYLKETIGEKDYKFLGIAIPLITLFVIILDVLELLGLLTFPIR